MQGRLAIASHPPWPDLALSLSLSLSLSEKLLHKAYPPLVLQRSLSDVQVASAENP